VYKWMLVAAGSMALVGAHAGEPRKSLAQWPVANMQVVAATEYQEAFAVAASGASPIEVALTIVRVFQGSTQHIIQSNEGSESPVRSRVTVIRDGLLDDSIRGERWDIVLDRQGASAWTIKEVKRAWSCRRGARFQRFDIARCP